MTCMAKGSPPTKGPDGVEWPRASHWWIDAVGGYLALRGSVTTRPADRRPVRIGQAGHDNDVRILGDLSACHAELVQSPSGTILRALGPTQVNGKAGMEFLLRDQDRIRLRSVELLYRRPVPWTTTARLEIASPHRLQWAIDGILLLGDLCVLGPGRDAHIRTAWPNPVYLSWHHDRYWIRAEGHMEIDGTPCEGCGPLSPASQVNGSWGSFRFEPL